MKLAGKGMVLALMGVVLAAQPVRAAAKDNASRSARQVLAADSGWRFHLGDVSDGAEQSGYADASWRGVDLPHDWSIEGRPEKDNPSGAGGGFFPTGIGWYRKTFQAPAAWTGRRVSVEFDGIYRNATVYLNGRKLLTEPYGYTSFAIDLTSGLKMGGANTLAVRVDNSAQPNSRWYTGSGIYRHVRVVVTQPEHVAHWGVFVTTPQVSAEAASVKVQTAVQNEGTQSEALTVSTTVYDGRGNRVATADAPEQVQASSVDTVSQTLTVSCPALWSPEAPALYRAVTQVRRGTAVLDEVVTPFGIRSLTWSAQSGLLLNGRSIKLTGGSVHHDNGPLGAAAFDRAEERRVELLKAAGHNAVRTAHNIPSPAFLDACDRLGLLVLDEPFDVWQAHKVKFDYGSDFDANWKSDLAAMVKRDRNHPSIVIWGIGNEIPELTTEKGAPIAKQIIAELHSLDTTRPLTLAFPGTTTKATAAAVFSQLDITGYNYSLEKSYKQDHVALPDRLMLTTESFPAKVAELWEISTTEPYVLGDLTWTSMDYLGESGIGAWSYGTPEQAQMASMMMNGMMATETVDKMFNGMALGVDMNAAMSAQGADPKVKEAMAVMMHGYPWHAADCGDLDLTGFRKPQSYYRDILWNGGDRVYATVRLPEPEGKKIIAVGWATFPSLPSWTWPGQEGKPLQVEVYSGADRVQLLLNGKLLGEQPTGRAEAHKATFSVPYAPGELVAVGLRNGKPVARTTLHTAGPAATLRLSVDRQSLHADGQDLAFVTVELVDKEGQLVQSGDQNVTFTLNGPGTIAAVGNGDGEDSASYHGDQRKLFHGRAEVIVRTTKQAGGLNLRAESAGTGGAVLAIASTAAQQVEELR